MPRNCWSRHEKVEIWFGKLQQDDIGCGAVTSAEDRARKLLRYIRGHDRALKTLSERILDSTGQARSTRSSAAVTGYLGPCAAS